MTEKINLAEIAKGDTLHHRRDTFLGCVVFPLLVVGFVLWKVVKTLWDSPVLLGMLAVAIVLLAGQVSPSTAETVAARVVVGLGLIVALKIVTLVLRKPLAEAIVLAWDAKMAMLTYTYQASRPFAKKMKYAFQVALEPVSDPQWAQPDYKFMVRHAKLNPEIHTIETDIPYRKPFTPHPLEYIGQPDKCLTKQNVIGILQDFARKECGDAYVPEIKAKPLYVFGPAGTGLRETVTWYLSRNPGLALQVTIWPEVCRVVLLYDDVRLDEDEPNLGLTPQETHTILATPEAMKALLDDFLRAGVLTWKN